MRSRTIFILLGAVVFALQPLGMSGASGEPGIQPDLQASVGRPAHDLRLMDPNPPELSGERPAGLPVSFTYRRLAATDLAAAPEHGVAGGGGFGRVSPTRLGSALAIDDTTVEPTASPTGFSVLRGAAVTLGRSSGPRFTLAFNRTTHETTPDLLDNANPLRRPFMDQAETALSGQVSYTWRSLTLDIEVAKIRRPATFQHGQGLEALSSTAGLSAGLFDGRLLLRSILQWTEDQTVPGTSRPVVPTDTSPGTRFLVGSLTATGILVPGHLTLDSQVSLTRGEDGSGRVGQTAIAPATGSKTATLDGMVRLMWSLGGSARSSAPTVLSLELEWSRPIMGTSPAGRRSDLGAFLSLELPAPFLF